MADITMCKNEYCSLNHKCKRHLATPNEYYQSYFQPLKKNNERCKYFIEASKTEKERYWKQKEKAKEGK